MASQVERVFYGSNQVPGQQLSREDIKQLRFRIKRDDGTIDNVVFDPLVGQDLYMCCLKFFKNYSHGSNPTEVGHYEVGEAGANGNDFNVEINNQEIFLFREDDLVLTDGEFDRLNADLVGWTPVALRSMSSDNVQHQWLYLSRSPDTGIRFICIEDAKARIAVIAPDSPHNIAISDAFDTSLFELKSNKTSYIDPTIDQSGKYLGGNAVNGFVEKRTFAISIPYGTSNTNTFTKILEFDEIFDGSRTRGAIFARLKIQFVGTSIRHRLREIDAYVAYELNGQKAFVTFGNCYNTLIGNELKKLHVVTYDVAARRHIEVYLEHRELTAMTNWISVEVCENFEILEKSWTLTQTSHSPWKIPLASYHWDEVNGASVQPTAAALPTTGVLKTDSYIVQSGNQVPFTYVPSDDTSSDMAIAKLAKNSGDTRLVFKMYSSEGWVAIGKVERVSNTFKLKFSAIADSADFEAGVAVPYIYLSNLDGVYFVNLKIDSYHSVAKSIAIEVENVNKDWEFFGSIPPDSVGTTVSGTDTYMKADPTAEVIDQGTNVPAPTSSTKILTKQVDANGREFWKTEQMSDMIAGKALTAYRLNSVVGSQKVVSGDKTYQLLVKCLGYAYYRYSLKFLVRGGTGLANTILFITIERNSNVNGFPVIEATVIGNHIYSNPMFSIEYTWDSSTYELYLYGVTLSGLPLSPILLDDASKITPYLYYGDVTISAPSSTTVITLKRGVVCNDGEQVGSPSQPVYVTSDGTISKTITGINTFIITQAGYYELANMTFANGDYKAAGIQLAISWRDVNNYSGSGILAISFSDHNDTNIVGRSLISSSRIAVDQNFANRFHFYVERLSDSNFKLCAKIPSSGLLSFSLISGSPNTFTVPSTLTNHSGNATNKLPWSKLTTTELTPA